MGPLFDRGAPLGRRTAPPSGAATATDRELLPSSGRPHRGQHVTVGGLAAGPSTTTRRPTTREDRCHAGATGRATNGAHRRRSSARLTRPPCVTWWPGP